MKQQTIANEGSHMRAYNEERIWRTFIIMIPIPIGKNKNKLRRILTIY